MFVVIWRDRLVTRLYFSLTRDIIHNNHYSHILPHCTGCCFNAVRQVFAKIKQGLHQCKWTNQQWILAEIGWELARFGGFGLFSSIFINFWSCPLWSYFCHTWPKTVLSFSSTFSEVNAVFYLVKLANSASMLRILFNSSCSLASV